MIAHNRYLENQGIGSRGQIVNIQLYLDSYYPAHGTAKDATGSKRIGWKTEAGLAPGERQRMDWAGGEKIPREGAQPEVVKVEQALASHRRVGCRG